MRNWDNNLLPKEAQYLLKVAAAIDPDIPFGLSAKRQAALAEAIQTIRDRYPYLFKKEKERQNERKPSQNLWAD